MLILLYIIKAWIIGIAVAAPVGPIGMLCIRKTLELGFIGALSVGLGAALADGCYGFIASAGLTIVSDFLLGRVLVIKILGGAFLLYLGIKELRNKPRASMQLTSRRKAFLRLASQTFFLTLANPLTILSFIGIFASIGGSDAGLGQSIWMVIGVTLGSMTWWIILGQIIVKTRSYLSDIWLHRIRNLSALILIGFGVWALYTALYFKA